MAPAWLEVVDGNFVVVDQRVELVKEIFRLATEEGFGPYAIVTKLNKSGENPWGGKARNRSGLWGKTMVTRILTDRRVIGEFQPMTKMTLTKDSSGKEAWVKGKKKNEGHPIKGYYPKIIDENLFHRISKIREARGTTGGGRRPKSGKKNIFLGLAKCFCGKPLHQTNGNKIGETKNLYLKCSIRCGLKSTQYFQAKLMFAILCKMSREELEVVEQREDWRKEKDSKLTGIERIIVDKEVYIARLGAALGEAGGDNLEDVVEIIKNTRREIKDLEKERKSLEDQEAPTSEEQNIEAIFKESENRERALSEDELIRVLKLRYKKIIFRSSKIGKLGQRIEFVEVLKDGAEIFNIAEFDRRCDVDFLIGWNSNGSLDFDEWIKNKKIDRSILLRDSRPEDD
jgi:hypothetical protein